MDVRWIWDEFALWIKFAGPRWLLPWVYQGTTILLYFISYNGGRIFYIIVLEECRGEGNVMHSQSHSLNTWTQTLRAVGLTVQQLDFGVRLVRFHSNRRGSHSQNIFVFMFNLCSFLLLWIRQAIQSIHIDMHPAALSQRQGKIFDFRGHS